MYKNTTGKAIYANEDRSALVDEDSPDARFLVVGPNGELADEDAIRHGLMEAPAATSRVDALQTALDGAMARGATEEARVHRANLEAARAEDAARGDQQSAAKARRAAADKSVKAPPEDKSQAPAE